MSAKAWTGAMKPLDRRLIDLTGHLYGNLTVEAFAGREGRGRHIWSCRCDCGAQTFARADHLRAGLIRSCGCLRDAGIGSVNRTHGACVDRHRTPEYRAWKGIRERCERSNSASYARYGGRGIRVCDRWRSFELFLADMGHRPTPDHSVEREDNDGHYEPGNCRWATRLEQARNRRNNRFVECGTVRLTVSEWAGLTKLAPGTIIARLDRGWSPQRTLTTSLQSPRRAA